MPIKPSKAHSANHRRTVIVLMLLVFAVAGLVGMTISRAATSVASVEAESGTKAGNIAAGPTEGASAGASVKFGAASAGGCALPKYPDATCTGVPTGTQLTQYTPAGNFSIETPNTVIDGKEINGCITVLAPGVVIKRSKINCTAANRTALLLYDVKLADGTTRTSNVMLEDVEVNCTNPAAGIEGQNLTLRRLLIQGCASSVRSQGNLVLEDSFIRQMRNPVPIGTNTNPTASGVTFVSNQASTGRIQHNAIDATGGGWGINLGSLNQQAQVSVIGNYIKGGTWGISCPVNSTFNPRGSHRLIDNRFTSTSPKADIMLQCADELEVRGNAYFENGQPLP